MVNSDLSNIIGFLFTNNLEFWDCPSLVLVLIFKIMSMFRTVSNLNLAVRQCSRISSLSVQQRGYADMAFTFATPLKVIMMFKVFFLNREFYHSCLKKYHNNYYNAFGISNHYHLKLNFKLNFIFCIFTDNYSNIKI